MPRDRLELAPSIGASLVVERGMETPGTVRGGAVIGLTAGAIFR